MSPTQRTLDYSRDAGYPLVSVVERFNPHAMVRQDLFGVLDVLAIGPDVLGVQTTSGGNTASRVRKLQASEALSVLKAAGVRVLHADTAFQNSASSVFPSKSASRGSFAAYRYALWP